MNCKDGEKEEMSGRKPCLFAIKGCVMTTQDIARECQCSITKVYTWWKEKRGTDDEKFDSLKKAIQARNFMPGYVTLQQVAQKSHFPREMIYSFSKSKTGKLFQTEFRKDENTIQPQIMLKTVELEDFIMELKRWANKNSERHEKIIQNKKEAIAKKPKLEDLKKAHPLVTDDRFFEESFFPNIDSYFILDECNYHRAEKK